MIKTVFFILFFYQYFDNFIQISKKNKFNIKKKKTMKFLTICCGILALCFGPTLAYEFCNGYLSTYAQYISYQGMNIKIMYVLFQHLPFLLSMSVRI
jgi:hypothetical protein